MQDIVLQIGTWVVKLRNAWVLKHILFKELNMDSKAISDWVVRIIWFVCGLFYGYIIWG